MSRPIISSIKQGSQLRQWYWRKAELVIYARSLGLKIGGAKFEILERIANYLDSGKKSGHSTQIKSTSPKSHFDWKNNPLTPHTLITDNYKNTENVRNFFKSHLGPQFKFNLALMDWVKNNVGKTLEEALQYYKSYKAKKKSPGFKTQIKSHNQFNQYVRDFLNDNPKLSLKDARRTWSLKTQQPSANGRHVYDPSDLKIEPQVSSQKRKSTK